MKQTFASILSEFLNHCLESSLSEDLLTVLEIPSTGIEWGFEERPKKSCGELQSNSFTLFFNKLYEQKKIGANPIIQSVGKVMAKLVKQANRLVQVNELLSDLILKFEGAKGKLIIYTRKTTSPKSSCTPSAFKPLGVFRSTFRAIDFTSDEEVWAR
jgi:hypothetical protein